MDSLKRYTLSNCSLVDGSSDYPVENTWITISNGKIEAVGQGRAGGECIDLKGLTVLPGFINAHCHPGFKQRNGQDLPDYDRQYLAQCIASGVTTVRDMGALNASSLEDILAKKAEINRCNEFPHIVSPGKFLAAPGGYGGLAPLQVTDSADAKQAVRKAGLAGADFIKTSLELGLDPSTYGLPLLTGELLKAICDAALGLGLRVSAHLTQVEPLRQLVEAGITDAAHVPYEPMDDALIAQMVKQGIALTPTLTVHRMISEKYGAPVLPQALDNVRRFHRAGGILAVGDDFLEEESPWFTPGLPMGELELLLQAGLSRRDVIHALTAGGAEACGLTASRGTVTPGLQADLAVVRGNPLEDLACLRDAAMVIHRGQVVVDHR